MQNCPFVCLPYEEKPFYTVHSFSNVIAAEDILFRFLFDLQMETLYFLGIALGGGLFALFLSAGWSSFKHKKIPEKGILFRWFIAGLVTAGLVSYAWIFGSGGDMGQVMSRIGGALDIESVLKLTSALGTAAVVATADAKDTVEDMDTKKDKKEKEDKEENLKIGMPNF